MPRAGSVAVEAARGPCVLRPQSVALDNKGNYT